MKMSARKKLKMKFEHAFRALDADTVETLINLNLDIDPNECIEVTLERENSNVSSIDRILFALLNHYKNLQIRTENIYKIIKWQILYNRDQFRVLELICLKSWKLSSDQIIRILEYTRVYRCHEILDLLCPHFEIESRERDSAGSLASLVESLCQTGYIQYLDRLLKYLDPKFDLTRFLVFAVIHGQTKCLRYLLERVPDLPINNQEELLHHACQSGRSGVLKLLLGKYSQNAFPALLTMIHWTLRWYVWVNNLEKTLKILLCFVDPRQQPLVITPKLMRPPPESMYPASVLIRDGRIEPEQLVPFISEKQIKRYWKKRFKVIQPHLQKYLNLDTIQFIFSFLQN
jgi:hypothetical protein